MLNDIVDDKTTKEHDLYKEIDKVCKAYWKSTTENEGMRTIYIMTTMIKAMKNFVGHPDQILPAVTKIHTEIFADYE
jgi:hypothetical protein